MQGSFSKAHVQVFTHHLLSNCHDDDSSSMIRTDPSCPGCAAATAAMQQLQNLTNPAKQHPASIGHWGQPHADHPVEFEFPLVIEGDRATLYGNSPRLIERLAPDSLTINHKWGSSTFVLLPSSNQVVEVDYTEGQTHLWVKDERASKAVQ